MTQTDLRCTILTYRLLRRTDRDVDSPPTASALGRQDDHRRYDQILAIPPYVQPRCSTSDRAVERNIEYRQLHPRNQPSSITDSG